MKATTHSDVACLIEISAKEIGKCKRIMDLQELAHEKVRAAYQEILKALLPEIIRE